MQTLPPEYLAEIARQIGSLSAFLGGFAAAFFATLLTLDSRHRAAGWAVASAAFASMSFVVAVVACTKLVMVLHPQAPAYIAQTGSGMVRALATLGFMLGAYALLVSIGLSGWQRSRRLGLLTTGLAAGAGLLVTAMIVSV